MADPGLLFLPVLPGLWQLLYVFKLDILDDKWPSGGIFFAIRDQVYPILESGVMDQLLTGFCKRAFTNIVTAPRAYDIVF